VLIAWRRHAQLLVLLLLRDCLPLVVGQHLALLLGPALADHQIGRQYDGFERHDHGEAVRSGRARPGSRSRRQPDDVDADEPHRAGESRDLICDPVLHALPALLVCCSSAGWLSWAAALRSRFLLPLVLAWCAGGWPHPVAPSQLSCHRVAGEWAGFSQVLPGRTRASNSWGKLFLDPAPIRREANPFPPQHNGRFIDVTPTQL
jgi:hypothetical protein